MAGTGLIWKLKEYINDHRLNVRHFSIHSYKLNLENIFPGKMQLNCLVPKSFAGKICQKSTPTKKAKTKSIKSKLLKTLFLVLHIYCLHLFPTINKEFIHSFIAKSYLIFSSVSILQQKKIEK